MKAYFNFLILLLLPLGLFAQTDSSFVVLQDVDSLILFDVRYATPNNFTHRVLYPDSTIYLRRVVADSLSKANRFLIKHFHLRIKIFDGFRPLKIQQEMWKIFPDEKYVADPSRGSRHNRGAAVDVTIVDFYNRELDMGTGFDDFTEKAHYGYSGLSLLEKLNRRLLRSTMEKFGFQPLQSEWWHFDFKGWQKFPLRYDFPKRIKK